MTQGDNRLLNLRFLHCSRFNLGWFMIANIAVYAKCVKIIHNLISNTFRLFVESLIHSHLFVSPYFHSEILTINLRGVDYWSKCKEVFRLFSFVTTGTVRRQLIVISLKMINVSFYSIDRFLVESVNIFKSSLDKSNLLKSQLIAKHTSSIFIFFAYPKQQQQKQ